jgi:hypothetical protein
MRKSEKNNKKEKKKKLDIGQGDIIMTPLFFA